MFYVLTLDCSLWFDEKFLCKPDDLVALLKLRCTLRVTNNCPRQTKKPMHFKENGLKSCPLCMKGLIHILDSTCRRKPSTTQITCPWLKGKVRIWKERARFSCPLCCLTLARVLNHERERRLLLRPLSLTAALAGERLAARGPRANPDHMADAVARLCHTLPCFNDQLGSLGLN